MYYKYAPSSSHGSKAHKKESMNWSNLSVFVCAGVCVCEIDRTIECINQKDVENCKFTRVIVAIYMVFRRH